MCSGKRRRAEIKAARLRRAEKRKELLRMTLFPAVSACVVSGHQTLVNSSQLAPDGSYDAPEFVWRGYYQDLPFRCVDCDAEEIWSAERQKWWYEVIKGGVWTTAKRCKACRDKDRERRELARKSYFEGMERKTSLHTH